MKLHQDISAIIHGLREEGLTIGFAESCTGGRLAADLTMVPGSSDVVAGSVVAYKISAKRDLLGLSNVNDENVVSAQTAADMAEGALPAFMADIGVGTTGYLDGDRPEAFWSITAPNLKSGPIVMSRHLVFPKDSTRENNREIVVQSVMEALTYFAKRENQ